MARVKRERATKFIKTRKGQHFFKFVCVGCEAEGEIGIPTKDMLKPFGCPEGCGATYVMWRPSPDADPLLRAVVVPGRARAAGVW